MSTSSPLQLGPTGHPVVRLNRRAIYVVGAVLIGAVLTGLIAIRAQGSRARLLPEAGLQPAVAARR